MTPDTPLHAVAGHPILHSRSPRLFAAAYGGTSAAAPYTRLAARSAEEIIRLVDELHLTGINVTAPYKQSIVPLVPDAAPAVRALGAANTITRQGDRLIAHNTDIDGVTGALSAAGITPRGLPCLVLGAGGAGSAAALALRDAGARVTIANRTADRATALATLLGCAAAPVDASLPGLVAASAIIVNTLPAGVDLLREQWIDPRHVILDAIYRDSPLAPRAARRRARYIPGLDWLLHQAIPSYRLLTGAEPDREAMETLLSLPPPLPPHIALVGPAGAGKTTIARLLADATRLPLADTDREIERCAGQTVPRLIATGGERAFRDLELQTLRDLLDRPDPRVISCGGGIVTLPEARQILRARATVIWLHATPEDCVERIDVTTRPLLLSTGDTPLAAATTLYERRKPLYTATAGLVVDTTKRDPLQITKIIHEEINTCIRG